MFANEISKLSKYADSTDQRQQQRVEVCCRAAGVHAEDLAALQQALVDGASQAWQQHLTLPQAVNVNRKCSQVLRKNQLQNTNKIQCVCVCVIENHFDRQSRNIYFY